MGSVRQDTSILKNGGFSIMSEGERQEICHAKVRQYSQNLNCHFGQKDVVPCGPPTVLLHLAIS